MIYSKKTEYGKIDFDKGIVAGILSNELKNWRGKVFLSNLRGKLLKNKYDDAFEITIDNDTIELKIYLVLKFGLSIRRITHELISSVKENISDITGIKVGKVTIVLTGMMSQKLSKRHIEVSG